jgi:hypothetical protein
MTSYVDLQTRLSLSQLRYRKLRIRRYQKLVNPPELFGNHGLMNPAKWPFVIVKQLCSDSHLTLLKPILRPSESFVLKLGGLSERPSGTAGDRSCRNSTAGQE